VATVWGDVPDDMQRLMNASVDPCADFYSCVFDLSRKYAHMGNAHARPDTHGHVNHAHMRTRAASRAAVGRAECAGSSTHTRRGPSWRGTR
jgi:hypothetical protein